MDLSKRVTEERTTKLEELGFKPCEYDNKLLVLNKGAYRFFLSPLELYLQAYRTKDGSNAKSYVFLALWFDEKEKKKLSNLKELTDVLDGF